MATNEIPATYTPLVALAEDAADGAKTHGAAIGLKQNTETAICERCWNYTATLKFV